MIFKSIVKPAVFCLLAFSLLPSCEDPADFFEPVNPDLLTGVVIGQANTTQTTLNGAERQLSLVINQLVPPAEIASDNYRNTQTFFNQNLDRLDINFVDQDIRELEFDIARLRELSTNGIEVIYPADPAKSDDVLSGLYLTRGLAYLIGGESFAVLPAAPGGAPQPSSAHYALAIADFTEAISLDSVGTYGTAALLARARAYYRAGNRDEAVADAQQAIDATPTLLYTAKFDPNNDSGADDNLLQDALFDRGSFDDLQPLPALDFLDPKYNGSSPTEDLPIPVVKIEEAHLILAEAELSQGNLEQAKEIMSDIVGLVATRPTATFDDRVEGRTQRAPGSRPNTSNVVVAPGPDRDFEDGLVLERQSPTVTIPTISGTSFTEEDIEAIDNIDFAYEELYRLRQQIFISEGRRMADLGIKFPVSERESAANSNISEGDNQPTIPSWLVGLDLDAYTYDVDAGQVTITNNLNRITTQNRSSDLVVPFE